jgi:hypothetical protein
MSSSEPRKTVDILPATPNCVLRHKAPRPDKRAGKIEVTDIP